MKQICSNEQVNLLIKELRERIEDLEKEVSGLSLKEKCGDCNGTGVLLCENCNGRGYCEDVNIFWCGYCGGKLPNHMSDCSKPKKGLLIINEQQKNKKR